MLFELSQEYPAEFHAAVQAKDHKRQASLELLEQFRNKRGHLNSIAVKEAYIEKTKIKFQRRQLEDECRAKRKALDACAEERQRAELSKLILLRESNIECKLSNRELSQKMKIDDIIDTGRTKEDTIVQKKEQMKFCENERVGLLRKDRASIGLRNQELEDRRNKAIAIRHNNWRIKEREYGQILKQQIKYENRLRVIRDEKRKALAFQLFHKPINSN
jgi:hypothetical protein